VPVIGLINREDCLLYSLQLMLDPTAKNISGQKPAQNLSIRFLDDQLQIVRALIYIYHCRAMVDDMPNEEMIKNKEFNEGKFIDLKKWMPRVPSLPTR